MGDVLMTTPAIAALREAGRHVTLLTSESGAAAAALVPEIDETWIHDAPWMKATALRGPDRDLAFRDRLAAARFDAAVIFTTHTQSPLPAALFCFLAGIPLRLAHCRENPYQLLTDWIPEPEPGRALRHEVRRQLDLVASVGCATADERLRLRVPDEARDRVRRQLAALGLAHGRWVLLHPGATAASRRYPPELFAEAARAIAETTGRAIVWSGSAAERGLIAEIRERMGVPSISLAGALDFADLAALVEAAPLLVSNNTGPVHVAAAVGTRVVVLYALTNPQHTPWSVPHRVLSHDVPCRDCYKSVCPEGHQACLRGVPPAEVARAARSMLTRATLPLVA
jgi:lipopolysaccharide heptosyltransferase II